MCKYYTVHVCTFCSTLLILDLNWKDILRKFVYHLCAYKCISSDQIAVKWSEIIIVWVYNTIPLG